MKTLTLRSGAGSSRPSSVFFQPQATVQSAELEKLAAAIGIFAGVGTALGPGRIPCLRIAASTAGLV